LKAVPLELLQSRVFTEFILYASTSSALRGWRLAFAWINLCAVPVFVTAGIWERLVWDAFQCWRQNKAGVGCVRQREVGFTLGSSEAVP
jgi:uncharacterized membrane protein